MSVSRPDAGNREFLDAEVLDNSEIEDAGDRVISSMSLSMPIDRINPVVCSMLDLQCMPPPAVLQHSRIF